MGRYNLLKEKNIKITSARKVILNILEEADEAVSAEYVYEKCTEIGDNINLSTVYRTLETFEEKGIVKKFNLGDDRYSYSISHDEHKHIVECNMCHKCVEVECPIQVFEEIIKNKTGFTIMEHDFHIKGICKQCRDKLLK
ncbi:transcriptional repressor [Clostridium sp. 19966]|uniref:Fur family transcriptional regulator n=1 Tax=Clostridium sp. 19966 TaxID=2768166 RepID=UPI0028DE4C33|nr:Fur family transcriptional regulator [Clostridium sp. 19966]MDT8719108.1 transcriptional repressor [Clostridium sp. 19966]